jgi:predicted transcriptional regulator
MDQSVPKEITTIERKIYSGLAARAIKLLGSGASQAETSRALGVSEAMVSQWMAEKDFAEQVSELVKKNFADQSVIDDNYNAIEKSLSDRLRKSCEFMFDPDKVLRALKFVNEAKRKIAPSEGPNGSNGSVTVIAPVTLILPAQVAGEFILNPNNEIVGINGKEVVTISSRGIEDLARTIKTIPKSGETKLKQLENKHGSGQQDPWSNL